jgi:hypothetical protein
MRKINSVWSTVGENLPENVNIWFSVDPIGIGVATLISEKEHKDINREYER